MSIAMPLRTDILPTVGTRRRDATVPVTIYGRRLCATSRRIRRALARAHIDYQFVDLDRQQNIERQLCMIVGTGLTIPVVSVDGEWLMTPTMQELEDALERHGLC